MKVLLVHNYYKSGSPSGEDSVFENEKRLLTNAGVDVSVYARYNDDINESNLRGRLSAVSDLFWSSRAFDDIRSIIQKRKPDIAHFHNTFPLVSASGYAACLELSVPVVQTLHNYRLVCANGVFLRDGNVCERCLGKSPVQSIRFGCYRNSRLASAAVTAMLMVNRKRHVYESWISRYIALTKFAADKFVDAGLPKGKIAVKPNFLPNAPAAEFRGRREHFIYVGRLGEEKGIRTLLEAWKHIVDIKLLIVGDGPLRDEVVSMISSTDINAEYIGFRSRDEVLKLVARAKCQIVPSLCYEGFPMVILEAFACGTPVICSKIGSLEEIVAHGDNGLHFRAGDSNALRAAVDEMVVRQDMNAMGKAGRQTFLEKYDPDTNCEQLLSIYDSVLLEYKKQGSGLP